MNSQEEKLTPKQEEAILALLELPTVARAAEKVGVNESTLYRWLRNDDFRQRYFELRRELVKQSLCRIQQIVSNAVEALNQIVTDPAAPPASRISAARELIKWSTQIVKDEEKELRQEKEEKRKRIGRSLKVMKEGSIYTGSDGRYYTEEELKEVTKYEPVVVKVDNLFDKQLWPWSPKGTPIREIYDCSLHPESELEEERVEKLEAEMQRTEASPILPDGKGPGMGA